MNMKNTFVVLFFFFFLSACSDSSKGPDVSDIKVEVPVERFDKDFFSIDTNNIADGLLQLMKNHPTFYTDFMQQILGVSGSDSNKVTLDVCRKFISGYFPIYQSLNKKYNDVSWIQKELQQAYQYVRYYFPNYKTGSVVFFIGPLDAPGVAVTNAGLAVGLHQFGGRDFPPYQSMEGQQLFPEYISRRFSSEYILANSMKAVVDEIYPNKSLARGLIEQMIEKGKQWWLLDKFLPSTADSIKTGYTKEQLDWCKENEGLIWQDIITTQKDLFTKDPMAIQNYIGEAPFTQSLGPASPGNIGQWIGWHIVRKFADKNSSIKVEDVLKTDARKILEEAKYKPK